MLIFDIGAYIGDFTQKCVNSYTDCFVICVEPNPENYIKLYDRFKNNKNIITIPKIVSQYSNQLIEFYPCNVVSTACLEWIENSRFTGGKWGNQIKIISINLNDLIYEYGNPDLIKIDVEGYEYEVLSGLTQKSGVICFEWVEEHVEKIKKCLNYLQNLGYEKVGYLYGDEYLKEPNYTNWEEFDLFEQLQPAKKEKWGMIWVK